MTSLPHQIYDDNYKLLLKLYPFITRIDNDDRILLTSDNHMPFSISLINRSDYILQIAIAHYKKQNDDLVPDPEITLKLNTKYNFVEVLSYQDEFGIIHVYNDKGEIDLKERDELNKFLRNWLLRLLKTGYQYNMYKNYLETNAHIS